MNNLIVAIWTLLLSFSDAQLRHSFSCPSQDDPLRQAVLLPHPASCNKYLLCDHGVAKEENCPAGLHFNPSQRICDFPSNAGCHQVGEVVLPNGCPLIEVEGDYVFIPHRSDCTKFMKCEVHGIAMELNCPYGLHFSLSMQTCTWPSFAGCSAIPVNVTAELPAAVGSGQITCPSPDPLKSTVHLPHQTNCHLFYRCDHGKPSMEVCPNALHFNPVLQVCDWPDKAGCKHA